MSISHAGSFQIVAEEAHEDSEDLDAPSVVGEPAFFDGRPRSATLGEAMLLDHARILALRLRMASSVIASRRG
jgi:hypothetical protein